MKDKVEATLKEIRSNWSTSTKIFPRSEMKEMRSRGPSGSENERGVC